MNIKTEANIPSC